VTHLIERKDLEPWRNNPVNFNSGRAASVLLFAQPGREGLRQVYEDGRYVVHALEPDPEPAAPAAGAVMNPVRIGDAQMHAGRMDRARVQYEKALEMNVADAAPRLLRIQAMAPLDTGDYYFDRIKELKQYTLFKPALDAYCAALAAADGTLQRQAVTSRMDALWQTVRGLAPHVWGRVEPLRDEDACQ
jgi:tetratricopeptide (TPR) repeat protein